MFVTLLTIVVIVKIVHTGFILTLALVFFKVGFLLLLRNSFLQSMIVMYISLYNSARYY